jgi:hypothetical protein
MKIVVQHLRTKQFLGDGNGWVESAGTAKAFGSSIGALRYCVNERVRDAQIVVYFADKRPPLIVPCEQPN